jgi:hypothetical protein
MKNMKPICLTLAVTLLLVCSLSAKTSAQEELEIAGMPVKVIREFFSTFKTQFIEVVIPNEQYSKENLIKVWKHYCEKYPDKKIRLDLRVFTQSTHDFNRQLYGLPSGQTKDQFRNSEAYFERMGKGAAAFGGDNELLIYSPDLNKPSEKVRVVLAGEDPYQ